MAGKRIDGMRQHRFPADPPVLLWWAIAHARAGAGGDDQRRDIHALPLKRRNLARQGPLHYVSALP
jgi:hypothetical protein